MAAWVGGRAAETVAATAAKEEEGEDVGRQGGPLRLVDDFVLVRIGSFLEGADVCALGAVNRALRARIAERNPDMEQLWLQLCVREWAADVGEADTAAAVIARRTSAAAQERKEAEAEEEEQEDEELDEMRVYPPTLWCTRMGADADDRAARAAGRLAVEYRQATGLGAPGGIAPNSMATEAQMRSVLEMMTTDMANQTRDQFMQRRMSRRLRRRVYGEEVATEMEAENRKLLQEDEEGEREEEGDDDDDAESDSDEEVEAMERAEAQRSAREAREARMQQKQAPKQQPKQKQQPRSKLKQKQRQKQKQKQKLKHRQRQRQQQQRQAKEGEAKAACQSEEDNNNDDDDNDEDDKPHRIRPRQRGRRRVSTTYRDTWLTWRNAFRGPEYSHKIVARVRRLVARLLSWCEANAPRVVDAMLPGATEFEFRAFARKNKITVDRIPIDFRIFYRFIGGQKSLSTNHDILGSALFGAYGYYTTLSASTLSPLRLVSFHPSETTEGIRYRTTSAAATAATEDADDEDPDDDIEIDDVDDDDDNGEHDQIGGDDGGDDEDDDGDDDDDDDDDTRADNRVMQFTSSPCNQKGMGISMRTGIMCARTARGHWVRACPRREIASTTPPTHALYFLDWLQEYVRRLENGTYIYGPVMEAHDDTEPRYAQLQLMAITLFPRTEQHGARVAVTNGVQIEAFPVLMPEAAPSTWDDYELARHRQSISLEPGRMPQRITAYHRRGSQLVWSYRINMRLLEDHPSRPAAMRICQLQSRCWKISDSHGAMDDVQGSGVVGLYPVLDVDATAPAHPFGYASCTGGVPPGTMGGTFTMVPGRLSNPTGPAFEAQVPTFRTIVPDFIY